MRDGRRGERERERERTRRHTIVILINKFLLYK